MSGYQGRAAAGRVAEALPDVERAVSSCETVRQKENWLSKIRDNEGEDGELLYSAYIYEHPEETLEKEDPKAADWRYTGPYLNLWDEETHQRILQRDDNGNLIPIRGEQRALFGVAWTRTWQEPPSQAGGEDLLLDLGPMDEVVRVEAPPPGECTWDEVREVQRVEKREWERVKRRGGREEWEVVRAMRMWFRRLRTSIGVSRVKGEEIQQGGVRLDAKKAGGGMEKKGGSKVKTR